MVKKLPYFNEDENTQYILPKKGIICMKKLFIKTKKNQDSICH